MSDACKKLYILAVGCYGNFRKDPNLIVFEAGPESGMTLSKKHEIMWYGGVHIFKIKDGKLNMLRGY